MEIPHQMRNDESLLAYCGYPVKIIEMCQAAEKFKVQNFRFKFKIQLFITQNCKNCPFSDSRCPKTDSFSRRKNSKLQIFSVLKIWHEL